MLVLGGTGSVKGGNGLYLVVLGQYGVVLVHFIHDGTGSVEGGTAYHLMLLGQ